MPSSRRRRSQIAQLAAVAAAAALVLPSAASAAPVTHPLYGVARIIAAQHAHSTVSTSHGKMNPNAVEDHGDSLDEADVAEAYANQRTAPADSVSAAALVAARNQAASLPTIPAGVTQVTNQPMDAEPNGYTDPVWSNDGAGFRHVSGRVTSLATDGRTYYAGTADGGVWRSTNAGTTWKPIWDSMDSLSIGAVTIGPDHSVWVGTGEANTNSDSYQGVGVYRSTDGGTSFFRVGGSELLSHQVFSLRYDGVRYLYAATSQGLYRHRVTTAAGAWELVLKPDPNPTDSPYATSFITDVAIKPGSNGQNVLAVLGWRGGSSYNGFYLSTTGGAAGSFTKIAPSGIDNTDIGRTTLAYAADGSVLYAVIQSPSQLNSGADSVLKGVYKSANGDPNGPWTLIADSAKLGASGSALQNLPGYHVGIQAWYNQFLTVDPTNPQRVFLGLEEVFETQNGGTTWATDNPYWNYGLTCPNACPPATHPDQHAVALSSDGQLVIGNDGGVYSRPLTTRPGYGHWIDLNDTLYTLQYYDAAAANSSKGLTYWGGLQDNGTTVLNPGASTNIEPAGGDGGYVLVNPTNGKQAVGEYTNLAMYSTQDGGHSFTTISPACGYNPAANCDPAARFTAPFQADIHDPNHWVAGGNKVWVTTAGFGTTCDSNGCSWKPVHGFGRDSSGGYNAATAVAVSGVNIYAAWVGGGGNPGPAFASGIDTNYGGTWHRISSPVLPNRYIAGLTVDPANPAHVFAVYNGYSRRWIPGGGTGTVFESKDGGTTWANISGNLPDAPGDALAVVNGRLVLATDVGVFMAQMSAPKSWAKVSGLPNTSYNSIRPVPGTNAVVLGSHGRGVWQVTVPRG